MKTLKLKHSEKSKGKVSLQNPNATIGYHNGVITLEITEIPDNISNLSVVSLVNKTAFWAGDRHSFKYSELGEGKIVR